MSTEYLTCVTVLVLFLPVYQVWNLLMPLTRKIMVICIFLLGGLVSIVGIIRLHYLRQLYSAIAVSSDSPCRSAQKQAPR